MPKSIQDFCHTRQYSPPPGIREIIAMAGPVRELIFRARGIRAPGKFGFLCHPPTKLAPGGGKY